MTNVSGTPAKKATRQGLFEFAIQTLEKRGWAVSRIPRGGKASLRLISKGTEKHKVSIRTSQDAWIAFPRKSEEAGWVTLDDVDYVVAASVNDRHNPTEARVHMIPADDARARFDRAYDARKSAGHTLPIGRGIWLSLYDKEANDPVSYVGAGMGLDYSPLAVLNLTKDGLPHGDNEVDDEQLADEKRDSVPAHMVEASLTIPEAKRRLAETLGVPEVAIKIIIEH
ncbi:hypothetical protein GHK51_14880 [Sinorhizobium meliloti]|uniref:hypothetical protein n=1 Tax=Rhizobium meliloti TaxID=382 RepID=UPI001294A473|nr:hypothetical protein [Sinorhizobium meliloti]MQW11594.1 hypothetical protein [Sinorhizobium meliloti]